MKNIKRVHIMIDNSIHSCPVHTEDVDLHRFGVHHQSLHSGSSHHIHQIDSPPDNAVVMARTLLLGTDLL